ncbi:hypothetical protein DFS30_03555 [Akkermansia muciniphila]|nr:hypothetical protein C1I90_03805 [Akkermansia muciniphila]QAA63885.1 hypothetical protein C1O60_03605 [Akkermansia muciniphila]QAA66140.1 hypothetical protein C1O61_03660 [Akkermansia muciniphila]QAA68395.1 hypothetical protein C1O62_03595 [Akkermansia muciniphila]QHV23049.1 hypothetical protein C5O13_03545 [Akkermansia muciniphila]
MDSHFCRVFPELPEPWASGIFQSSLPVSLLNLARLPGSRKGGEREKFLFALREKQGREGGNLPCPYG